MADFWNVWDDLPLEGAEAVYNAVFDDFWKEMGMPEIEWERLPHKPVFAALKSGKASQA